MSQSISPEEFSRLMEAGRVVDLIDVRMPAEFQEVHMPSARNVPLDTLDPVAVMKSRLGAAADPLYVVCASGGRSQMACAKFAQAGFASVVNVEGGTRACIKAGVPVKRGQKQAISLERQVRIAAGTLVLVGAALGWLVHPAFFGLSAFIGAGLVFAGITDTCGMGLVLARMPWNKASAPQACGVKGKPS